MTKRKGYAKKWMKKRSRHSRGVDIANFFSVSDQRPDLAIQDLCDLKKLVL